MRRRDFVRAGLAGLAGLAARRAPARPVPRVGGGINVQPLRRLDSGAGLTPPLIVPELVDAQMRAIYELGFASVRVTISFDRFGPDFLAAIPYVRAARALGIDVVGLIGQFAGFELVQALLQPETRDEVLETYVRIFGGDVLAASASIGPGRFAAQVLNEPTHFLGISPEFYVRNILRPAYLHLKEDDPRATIVSAATVGSAAGVLRARALVESGLELWCDRVAFHVYGTRFLRELAGLTERPVWVTESGVEGVDRHFEWLTNTFELIRLEIPRVEEIFWFDLFDLEPGRFRLIDLRPGLDGSIEPVPESPAAVAWLRGRVAEALGGAAPAPYRELVPDITLYFPTEEDLRILRSTSMGSRAWRR